MEFKFLISSEICTYANYCLVKFEKFDYILDARCSEISLLEKIYVKCRVDHCVINYCQNRS